MPRYLAEWVLPMTGPPIRRGWIDVARGRVASVGSGADRDTGARVVNLGAAAILPALVNAHTHLELSGLRGDVPPGGATNPLPTPDIRGRREPTTHPPIPFPHQ